MTGTGFSTHSYSPRPAVWLLAGLVLACAVKAAAEADPEPSADADELPRIDIILVWIGDQEETPEPPPEPAPTPEPAPEAAPEPTPVATLDLDGLEDRLRKSDALGFFTKLELKNQVGDLVDEIDDYHRQSSDLNLDQLQERFDLLLFKLLLLLQDDDPELHQTIADASPALWAALSDPVQFALVKGP